MLWFRWLLFLCACVLPLRAQFLVPDQQYRCPEGQASCRAVTPLHSVEQRTTGKGHTFSVHYVEVNDRGALFDAVQLDEVLRSLRQAPANGKVTLLVLYINGWQNNANEPACGSPPCGDVPKFRDTLLSRLADDFPAFNVMGVYLGWRGLTFTVEPFKHVISYWPRRAVARRVGQLGMHDAVLQIKDAVAENRQQFFFVLAGHSFGARVLENAADGFKAKQPEGFMKQYRQQLKEHVFRNREVMQAAEAGRPYTDLPADLILYINAATSSAVTRKTIADTDSSCAADPGGELCKADPFYVAVTTHADWATGVVMPIANLVFPALHSDGLHLFSAANLPWLRTHRDPAPSLTAESCRIDEDAPVGGFCFHLLKGDQRTYLRVAPVPGKMQHRFWIFAVNRHVMSGHTDVWNPTVTDMVVHIIARNRRAIMLNGAPPSLQ